MKKYLFSLFVLMLGLSVFWFAGCSKQEQPQELSAGAGIGTAENPVKVSYIKKDVDPITDKEVTKELELLIEEGMASQGMYVDLEFLSAPTGAYATVVPIAFRTGQFTPDVIYFQGGDLPIAQEGLLIDLGPYVEKSQWVKGLLQDHNKAALANYPYLLWLAPPRIQIPVIREDHFQKLRSAPALMADPTVDNYYALFKELKDTGLVKWPVTTDGTILKLDAVFNHAFGVTSTIMKKGNAWVYYHVTDENKNKLDFYAKLFREGLLDNEYVTKAWDTMEQAFYEGTAGWVSGSAGAVIDVYDNKMFETQGVHLVVLPPAKGISHAYQSLDVSKEPRGFAINADSQVKDAAWAFLDFMASPQGRVLDKLGLEGTHYNLVDGKYVLTPAFSSWWARVHEGFNGLDTSNVVGEVMTKAGAASLEAASQYFSPDTNVVLPEDLIPLKDAMDKLYLEYSTDIIRGVRPISDFAEFVTKWNASGGAQISEYLATVLN
ncbi:extracellular solute-binding protein [Treponema sp. TIM-1]|uniref:extracellular solute-binding protein n=1 Tax=Treponema sp. TIM-1 TaxID=2898417 RepID=UPI0039817267